MKYIDEIKKQAAIYGFAALAGQIGYGVACYLGWRDAIYLTPDHIVTLLSFGLTFVFGTPIFYCFIEKE